MARISVAGLLLISIAPSHCAGLNPFTGGRQAMQPMPGDVASLLALVLANGTPVGAAHVVLASCANLSENAVFGFGVGSINEEYARAPHGLRCDDGGSASNVRLDRPLRFAHEKGERIDIMPDSLQVPNGAVYAQPPNPDVHAMRAVLVANRAHEWITLYARVVSSGPDKWPLRHLLLALAFTLIGSCCCAVVFQCCASSRKQRM